MSLIRIATANLLESATTITDSGTPTTGYPVTRLYDRNVARQMRIATAGARDWTFTGGVAAISVNALILAAGHNVGGLAYTLAKSANGTDWTTVSTGTLPAGTGVIVIEFAATTGAYWKLTLPNDTSAIMTEMMLTNTYTFTHQADRETSYMGKTRNLQSDQTSAGSERWTLNGPVRRTRRYSFLGAPSAMTDEIEARVDALGGTKPFFLCDHNGVWIWGNIVEPVEPQEVASISGVYKDFVLDFREAL